MDESMNAPLIQDFNLEAVPGVVIRQVTQMEDIVFQVTGLPMEAANKYQVKALPEGKKVCRSQGDKAGWSPSGEELHALPPVFGVIEESDACDRCWLACGGCLNLRAMTLHYMLGSGTDMYKITRPCMCGGACCQPLEMTLSNKEGKMVGMVKENFDPFCGKCCAACCCTYYQDIYEGPSREKLTKKYGLKTTTCCLGDHNNCCGATCFKEHLLISVSDENGKQLAPINKTYGKEGGAGACCRCCFDLSNYLVEFPPDATADQRALLMAGVFSQEFAYFDRDASE